MTERKCYTAFECSVMLGVSLGAFYEMREKLHARGMPQPVTPGRIRIPKLAFDAWLNRDHPLSARRPPDNDPVPTPKPGDDDQHRAHLRLAYGTR